MEQLRIAAILGTSAAFDREVLRGVAAYARGAPTVSIYVPEHRRPDELEKLGNWGGQGLIVHAAAASEIDTYASLPLPIVNISTTGVHPRLVQVCVDNEVIGRLAAEHLAERGLRDFGALGFPAHRGSIERLEAFRRHLQIRTPDAQFHGTDEFRLNASDLEQQRTSAAGWLATLPRPTAVFAFNDALAAVLVHASRRAGRRIPEDLIVLGVDNDDLLCDFTDPPLSSIDVDAERVGFEACRVLVAMLRGEPRPTDPVRIRPLAVLPRRSTDHLALNDETVQAALRFIHRRRTGIGVDDVADAAGVCRRTLERRFAEQLGCSPATQIARVRLGVVQQMLADTDWSLAEIASRCHFRHQSHLTHFFRRHARMTPSAYRRLLQRRPSVPDPARAS